MVLPASIYNSLFPKIVVCGSVNNMYTSIYSIVNIEDIIHILMNRLMFFQRRR